MDPSPRASIASAPVLNASTVRPKRWALSDRRCAVGPQWLASIRSSISSSTPKRSSGHGLSMPRCSPSSPWQSSSPGGNRVCYLLSSALPVGKECRGSHAFHEMESPLIPLDSPLCGVGPPASAIWVFHSVPTVNRLFLHQRHHRRLPQILRLPFSFYSENSSDPRSLDENPFLRHKHGNSLRIVCSHLAYTPSLRRTLVEPLLATMSTRLFGELPLASRASARRWR